MFLNSMDSCKMITRANEDPEDRDCVQETLQNVILPVLTANQSEDHVSTKNEVDFRNSILSDAEIEAYALDDDNEDVPETGKWELITYYLFYNGNNGTAIYSYLPLIIQSLATSYGFDPTQLPYGEVPCKENESTAPCAVFFGPAGAMNVSSIVLLTNGLNFLLQVLIFTSIGSLADYKQYGRWILLAVTLISCTGQMVMLTINQDYEWPAAMVVSLVCFVTYGASLVFYAAIFPILAHNMPAIREFRRELRHEIRIVFGSQHEAKASVSDNDKILLMKARLAREEALARNHVSNISTAFSNFGFLICGIILYVIFKVYDQNGTNNYDANIASFFCGAYWLFMAIPWFILQRKRPGPFIPSNERWYVIGWKQVRIALKEARKLRYTFLYIVSYFVSSDGFNTTGQLISIIQNKITSFSATQATAFGLSNAGASIIGCLLFWYIQKRFMISTKFMLQVCLCCIFIVPLWGCIGIRSSKIGMHSITEFWIYNTWFGLTNAPVYAFAQTFLTELIPRNKEGLFFGLFGMANRCSSFIGPLVISAIINSTGYEWNAFPFCTVLCFIPIIIVAFINVSKSKSESKAYLQIERSTVKDAMQSKISMQKDKNNAITIIEEKC